LTQEEEDNIIYPRNLQWQRIVLRLFRKKRYVAPEETLWELDYCTVRGRPPLDTTQGPSRNSTTKRWLYLWIPIETRESKVCIMRPRRVGARKIGIRRGVQFRTTGVDLRFEVDHSVRSKKKGGRTPEHLVFQTPSRVSFLRSPFSTNHPRPENC